MHGQFSNFKWTVLRAPWTDSNDQGRKMTAKASTFRRFWRENKILIFVTLHFGKNDFSGRNNWKCKVGDGPLYQHFSQKYWIYAHPRLANRYLVTKVSPYQFWWESGQYTRLALHKTKKPANQSAYLWERFLWLNFTQYFLIFCNFSAPQTKKSVFLESKTNFHLIVTIFLKDFPLWSISPKKSAVRALLLPNPPDQKSKKNILQTAKKHCEVHLDMAGDLQPLRNWELGGLIPKC